MNNDYRFEHLELSLMGSMIAGHYSDNQMIYQQYALWLQERFLNQVDQDMMLNNHYIMHLKVQVILQNYQ